jgi:galactose oxidase-like protein
MRRTKPALTKIGDAALQNAQSVKTRRTVMRTTATLAVTLICAAATLRQLEAQTWTQLSPAISPPARESQAMAYDTAHGQTVLFGGDGASGTLNDTWVWDGANWSQKFPGTSPSPRTTHAMAYDSLHHQVVLFGGFNAGAAVGETWLWDGTNWTLQHPTLSPSARFRSAMAFDSVRQKVVLFGGNDGSGPLSDTWTWDGTNWTLQNPVASPPARQYHAMAFDPVRGLTVLFGGRGSGGDLSDTWTWDGTAWTQISPGANPTARESHAMTFDSLHAEVVLFGGFDGVNSLSDTWEWDGSNWTLEAPNALPSARSTALAFDSLHAQVVLFGGSGASVLADTWIFYHASFSSWNQRSPAASPPASVGIGAMAYDAAHMQTVFVEADNGATWLWDGTNWTLSATPNLGFRKGVAMAYDAQHDKVVLFGGLSAIGFPLSDTWLWDGTNWSEASPSTIPAGRGYHAMAYDAARQQVVMNGGYNGGQLILLSSYLVDTWVWDGTNWTQKAGSVYGPAFHAMAYDAAHAQVVGFGGSLGGGALNVTAVWDGTSWTQKSPVTSPPGRQAHAMVYDAALSQTVLFGGMNGSTASPNFLGDTWLWDGTNWTQQFSSADPSARHSHAMAYDSVHQQAILFGGYMGGALFGGADAGIFTDTWSWEAFSATPNTGSGAGPQVFNTTYFDNNGASDLQAVYLDFGSAGDSPHDCKMAYVPGSNSLFLFNDANNGVVSGSLVLGGGSSLSNSQCTLFGGSTHATLSGNNLTVPFDIQFLPAYGGLKNIFAVAQSYNGTQSGNGAFDVLGTWTPSPTTPGVVSVTPNSGGGLGPQVFSAKFSDSGGANDLQAVYLDFGSVGGFAPQNCIVVYTPGLNLLYLFNDNNTGAVGPISLGAGGGSISNSQCTLSSGTAAATLSGTILTVPFDITFKSGYGGKKFIFGLSQTYAGVQSNGGAQVQLGTWEPAASTPAAVSVTSPNGGSGLGPNTLTALYSDSGGANDLQVVYLSISGSTFLAVNSCNVGYEPGNNSLFLLSDNNSTIATLGEGGGSSVSNSQCTLSGGTFAATESGTSLTVPFTITFKSGFTGLKTIFGLAQTYDGTQSAITTLGSWTP